MNSLKYDKFNINFTFSQISQIREINFGITYETISGSNENSASIDFYGLKCIEYEDKQVIIIKFTNGVFRMDFPLELYHNLENLIQKSCGGKKNDK